MNALLMLIDTLLSLAFWVIFVQVVMSWLINFNIINTHQPFVYQVWTSLHRLTDPIYRPIRRVLPDLGGLDFAPVIVILGIFFLQNFLRLDVAPALL